MRDAQEVFNELESNKKESKEIRKEYKDVLAQNKEYQDIVEEIKTLKDQKAQHEMAAKRAMGNRWDKLEDLKGEMKVLKEMMSDLTIKSLVAGETLEVRDEYDNLHEPIYNVNFKKVN